MLNAYLFVILGLMLVDMLLETIADGLNVANLKTTLPAEFEGVYDADKYRKSLEYLLVNTRFAIFRRCVVFVGVASFIIYGGFQAADLFARSFALGSIWTGLIFAGCITFLQQILAIPFSIYHTFVIEERFGFNRTTARTFVGDLVKGVILSVLIGAPIFAALIYFFESVGPLAWLYSWIGFTAIQLLLTFLAPAFLLPLFNKFEPLGEGDLKAQIEDFARKQNFKLSGIYKMDSSKRSTKSNAFFTGIGSLRRLVLFDTLIERHSADELTAVVAHEIGHFKCRHIPRTIGLSIAITGVLFWGLGFFMNNRGLFNAFSMTHLSVYASLIFAMVLYSPALKLLSIFSNGLSRKFEFEADAYAKRTYGKSEALVNALKKLSVDNLSNLTPHPFKVLLDYTHPPVMRRIEALRAGLSRR